MSTALIFLPNFVHLTRSCVTMSWLNRSCCLNITLQYKHNHKEMFKGPSKSHSTSVFISNTKDRILKKTGMYSEKVFIWYW